MHRAWSWHQENMGGKVSGDDQVQKIQPATYM
jgi:hypothetical protein